MIFRETIYFINLRHAYLLSPTNAERISSRTVLLTSLPRESLNNERIRSMFYPYFKRHWFIMDCKDLEDNVESREQAALKLETGETGLIKTANKKRLKAEKERKSSVTDSITSVNRNKEVNNGDTTLEMESGNTWTRWISRKDRPTHRLKLWNVPYIGKKVDTIDWGREQLRRLNPQIESQQHEYLHVSTGKGGYQKLLQAIFVQFHSMDAAQQVYRTTNPLKPPYMKAQAIGVPPDQIIWQNLRIGRSERLGRRFLASAFLVVLIIFWAIPVAFVGAISNINYLTNREFPEAPLMKMLF